jgi:carbonic anhydrase
MITEPIWTYSGESGPADWSGLDSSYAACAVGRRQSPVDLSAAVTGERGDLGVSYHLNRLTFTDMHRTLRVTAEPGGVLTYLGEQYEFVELHFHAPSEHAFSGAHSDLEAHFVHAAADRSLAVVGVLFSEAEGHHRVDDLLTSIPPESGGSMASERLTDIQGLIPLSSRRYRYTGSLTTPPCTEGVEWIVMQEVQPVGRNALAAFTDRYPANNRPVQPLNDRVITLG